ncbi:MAG: M48 family metallopeptidase [bacterium]|jgi:STE24 endopeptidase
MKGKTIGGLLLLLTASLLALYLYFSLAPANVTPAALQHFSREEILAGHKYRQQKQVLFVLRFALQIMLLATVALGRGGNLLEKWVLSAVQGRRFLGVLLFFLVLWVGLRLVNLPISFYSSYVLEHRWGFSSQTMASWWADYIKGAAMDLVFSVVGAALFFLALRKWPTSWWLPAGLFMAGWLIVQTFLWPSFVAPLYNRFEPATEPQVVAMVKNLAQKADVPVQQVLVMDASRRTSKANAYFAGIGRTKRIVLYDTLLENYPLNEVEAVVAHEIAHWKLGHIRTGVFWGIVATFAQFYLIALVLTSSFSRWQLGHYPLRVWAVTLLFLLLTSFVTSPIQNGISRYMERAADKESVALVGNAEGAVALQLNLARGNRSDIVPPPFIEWFAYTHPSTLKRIELLQQAVKE